MGGQPGRQEGREEGRQEGEQSGKNESREMRRAGAGRQKGKLVEMMAGRGPCRQTIMHIGKQ